MKKLLFYISQFYRGGAEVSLLNLFKSIDYNKYEVDFIISNDIEKEKSLSKFLPKEVNLLDTYSVEKSSKSFLKKIKNRLLFNYEERALFKIEEIDFVKNKTYDIAFHVGEWDSPDFVAKKVNASEKVSWIHNDLNLATYFDKSNYFDKYLFVSKNSMEGSIKVAPYIENKSFVIHNIVDEEEIIKKSNEEIDDLILEEDYFNIVSVANIRLQKGHDRCLEVANILKKDGFKFRWYIIGDNSDKLLYQNLWSIRSDYDLKDNVIFLGKKENPYKYIKKMDLVAVLSDYESWNLVITESLILKKYIISTKTSGALEQIIDGENGFLIDFDSSLIAKYIEKIIKGEKKIKSTNSQIYDGIKEFYNLFDNEKNNKEDFEDSILYFIDNINYNGGAHLATFNQINYLKKKKRIYIYSESLPNENVKKILKDVEFIPYEIIKYNKIFKEKILSVLVNKNYSSKNKIDKIKMTFLSKILRKPYKAEALCRHYNNELFEKFEKVVVPFENSEYRKVVSSLKKPYKIQLIHTDYSVWRDLNSYTKYISKDDLFIYKNFDKIILLTEKLKDKFDNVYPDLSEKTTYMGNIMSIEEIKEKYSFNLNNEKPLKLITIGRLDAFKDFKRLVIIIHDLIEEGYNINLDIIGYGEQFYPIKVYIDEHDLKEYIKLRGYQKNPYKYFKDKDVFVLTSHYEGIPNTIYESLILGIPVLATNVGSISNQIENDFTGWLVNNDFNSILNKIRYLADNRECIDKCKEKLKVYNYDNEKIYAQIDEIFLN